MYHAACKVELQLFKRLYSQLTFFIFYKIIHLGSSGAFFAKFVQFSSFGWIFLVNLVLKILIANTLVIET